ncbi:PREDICTED: serine/threonine-protein phosphatase 6 regulatory ankyrin repeat subunit B-like [Branchiostoma belcheri]|uniref:Serine/threonine-protein phosphatase 6 regulatory ankyrin repeat subunit B-like n=1 Tax=Branchiostoma belcheri TaxID=7741 RepID=A0A6P5A9J4_BRABE|nr:PREDICTED: serine/threonine-protein phosphatase 6 regulatory ankyrin repeat subunit B-like [Branchiostoma belcheri]
MAEKANEALLDAADRGCLQGVKAALKAGADIDYIQPGVGLTGTGTALYIASFMGHVNVVRLLIRKGASVTKKSIGISCAPLHGAAIRGSTEVVELLVHHGATVDTRDAFQRTPIMMACLFKHVDTVRRLIEFGARVDLRDCGPVSVLGYCEVDAGA